MRQLLFFILILMSFPTYSQINGDVKIEWLGKIDINYGEQKINIPKFFGDSFNFDASNKTIKYVLKLEEIGEYEENNFQISNVVYSSISYSDISNLDINNIPENINVSIKNYKSRNLFSSFLSFSPIIKDQTGFKKVISFSFNLKLKNSFDSKKGLTKKSNSISNSVLSTGDWFRFYVEKSGVYKISKGFLKQLGLDVNNINPKKIHLYGNGGRMLPLANDTYYPNDMAENAIQIIGENDEKFDDNDYILFYGEGTDTWNKESETFVNLYDDKSYYYVTVQTEDGKRILNANEPAGISTVTVKQFDDYQFHEIDKFNIVNLGRQWLGESFEIDNEQEFEFNFPNIDLSIPVKLKMVVASAAFTNTNFKIAANNTEIGTVPFTPLSTSSDVKYFLNSFNASINSSEKIAIKLNYENNGIAGSKGYLDYISLISKRNLVGYGKQFHFQYDLSSSTLGIVSYEISNAKEIPQVWDVTDIYNVTKYENNTQDLFSFKANLGELRKYIAVDKSDFLVPLRENKSKISNQNIKGTVFINEFGQFQDVDYVIVTPSFLYLQAEKLADFHRKNSNLNTKVLTLESVYQEFSSGKQDVSAIRNCIKYIYDNSSSTDKKVKYVNLFGGASFDYKNRIPNNTNIVPIYHALKSNTVGESSYASDDFFGYMDDNEGNVINSFGGIDVAVGRMLVTTMKEGDEMVNKVVEYYDVKSYGNWRNNIVMISDDSDKSTDKTLQARHNQLADVISAKKPFINVEKILLDSYIQESSAGGNRYPKARTDLFNAFEKGALVFNYLGHGGEDGLSSERIWEKSDGENLLNQYRYPLFVTITCDFTRFDNPNRPTAGEFTYLNPKGGAIAMLSTIRTISQFNAENFDDIIFKYLLSYDSNEYTTIAEALRRAKNSAPSSSTNVVFYIGDPALKLAIAKPKIKLTKINDVPIAQTIEDFKSLAKIKINGEVTDENDVVLSNYEGEVFTKIFDKSIMRNTLNNDGISPPISFVNLGETIFRGNATVKNGEFEFSFVVPRDIRVPIGTGRISFYSKSSGNLIDNTGYDVNIKVGGVNENAPEDNISPIVKLYMNDENFISGGITNASPYLLAILEDENGINTASGIGHDITAVLDGDVGNTFILNDYFQTNLDDFTKGIVRFPLRNLSPGIHTITFKAWDVYNNPTISEIQFLVVGDESITLEHVLNYPNPFVNYTEFWFTHNRPFEPLEVQVQVYTITGKVVWTKNQIVTTEGFLSKEITWDGKDDFGNKIGKGVYVYKLTVKSSLTSKKIEKIEKLVIL